MAVPYTSQASIQGEIAQQWLTAALDDPGDGQLDPVQLAQIILDCSNRVDSYLSGIYQTPFSAYPNAPAKAAEYALMFCCEEIYRRRLMGTNETNPYKAMCDEIRRVLGLIAARDPKAPSFDVAIVSGFAPIQFEAVPIAGDASLI